MPLSLDHAMLCTEYARVGPRAHGHGSGFEHLGAVQGEEGSRKQQSMKSCKPLAAEVRPAEAARQSCLCCCSSVVESEALSGADCVSGPLWGCPSDVYICFVCIYRVRQGEKRPRSMGIEVCRSKNSKRPALKSMQGKKQGRTFGYALCMRRGKH